ncbi:MAG: hypothetical protein AAGG50_17610 [Bacteroidota bacterium]
MVSSSYEGVTFDGGTLVLPDYTITLKTDDGPKFMDMNPEAESPEMAYRALVDSVLAADWAEHIRLDALARSPEPGAYGVSRRLAVGVRADAETDSVYVTVPEAGTILTLGDQAPEYVLLVGRWVATEDVNWSPGAAVNLTGGGIMPTLSSKRMLGNEVGYVLWDNKVGAVVQRNVVAVATETSIFRGARADWAKSIEETVEALLEDLPWPDQVGAF